MKELRLPIQNVEIPLTIEQSKEIIVAMGNFLHHVIEHSNQFSSRMDVNPVSFTPELVITFNPEE